MSVRASVASRSGARDVVEIDGRRYDVVSDRAAGVALEPAITKTVEELRAAHGGRSLSPEEFDELFGDLPLSTVPCHVQEARALLHPVAAGAITR